MNRVTLIREQDPLKQGLKQSVFINHLKSGLIREQDPLKQGLKLKAQNGEIDHKQFVSKIH